MSKRKGKRDGVVESKRRDGTIVFSVRLRDATGRQHQEMVGTSAEGCAPLPGSVLTGSWVGVPGSPGGA